MRKIGLFILGAVFVVPLVAHAFPFGGRAGIVLICPYNSTIYTNLGPPRGGEYIWTTATKTYQFGPPAYAGQWILGLAGAPYYCIYQISPLTIYTGIAITMMGSSGPGAPAAPPSRNPSPPAFPPPTPMPSPSPLPSPGNLDHLVISEVFYAVDVAHGKKPDNEWVEIYNGTPAAISLAGWKLEDDAIAKVIPGNVILAPGRFLVVGAASTTRAIWNIPDSQFVALDGKVGDGLSNAGDRIILRNGSGLIIDAVSWGSNVSALNPSAPVASYGNSLSRLNLSTDTNTERDWGVRPPSPGR